MDPYKVLGVSESKVKTSKDLQEARHRAKRLFRRFVAEKKKFDAKKVLEAFEMIKQKLKSRPGEGVYKILGRSRKERELDKHFNHQTKEIRKNKDVKKALKAARKGSKRFLLPGQKERIPTGRKWKHRRTRRKKRPHIDALQGLRRLGACLKQPQKFTKVIRLLHRWMREYMNMDNREYIFQVLHSIALSDFIAEDPDARQDVIAVFEYALGYYSGWFDACDESSMLRRCWSVAAIQACLCFTDDPFILSATIAKLNASLGVLEGYRERLDQPPPENSTDDERSGSRIQQGDKQASAKDEVKREELKKENVKLENGGVGKQKLEAKLEEAKLEGDREPAKLEEAKLEEAELEDAKLEEAKLEDAKLEEVKTDAAEKGLGAAMALPVVCLQASPEPSPELWQLSSPGSSADRDDEVESLGSTEDVESLGSSSDVQEEAISLGTDSDCEAVNENAEISSGFSSEVEMESGDDGVEELGVCVFPAPGLLELLHLLRRLLVDRCLSVLFLSRGPLWARPKIDAFFQDVFYRRAIFAPDQQLQVEAWQARIKVLQKEGAREVGEANNPLEAHRPVVDSRENFVAFEADGGTWAAKQTFDVRDRCGGRQVIR